MKLLRQYLSENAILVEDGQVPVTCEQWLKFEVVDGIYEILNGDVSQLYERIDGIIYPFDPTLDGMNEDSICYVCQGLAEPATLVELGAKPGHRTCVQCFLDLQNDIEEACLEAENDDND